MLAQGDFATFLKAGKNEKADLLEKLTGTDVYSRISKQIFDEMQLAKSALQLVQQNIQGVELLSEEQLKTLEEEQKNNTNKIKSLEEQEKLQAEKIRWIDRESQLLKDITLATEQFAKSKQAVEQANPRFNKLLQVDSVQEIRDDYNSLEATRTQLTNDEKALNEQQTKQTAISVTIEKTQKDVTLKENIKTQSEEDYKKATPDIVEARKLDTQLAVFTSSLKALNTEFKTIEEQTKAIAQNIASIKDETTKNEITLQKIKDWFEQNKHYSSIIPNIGLIINYIKEAANAKKRASDNAANAETLKELRKKDDACLESLEKEAERLNNLLPTEVATLRLRLKIGKPCPVCGSTEHPISTEQHFDSIADEELTKAKEQNAAEIERVKNNIKNRNDEQIALKSQVDGYNESYKMTCNNIAEALKTLPNWQKQFDEVTLLAHLEEITKHWNACESKQNTLLNSANVKLEELKNKKEALCEKEKLLAEKQTALAKQKKEVEDLQSLRKKLFNGEDVNTVEKRFIARSEEATKAFNDATGKFNSLTANVREIEGVVSQIKINIKQAKLKEQTLDCKVKQWLNNRKDGLTIEQLAELLKNDNTWIANERKSLDELNKSLTTAQTTLDERNKNHDAHKQAKVKPAENETKDELITVQNLTSTQLADFRNSNTAISVALTNHKKDKERIKVYENELEQKKCVANNWEKLNVLFGSADGAKFKTIAQGYTLDVLLGYANKHLCDISDRYVLERVSPESLLLQVKDLDMLSEVRSVNSLSGGESFLISLALALGLSSLSSNQMSVESLFIDEGFGSLDPETLRVAMDVLERLQTQGRKIGVISHVAEMTERITTQIQVVKRTNGRSNIEIH